MMMKNKDLIIDIKDITEATMQHLEKLQWLNSELMNSYYVPKNRDEHLKMLARSRNNRLKTEMEQDYILLIRGQLEELQKLLKCKTDN